MMEGIESFALSVATVGGICAYVCTFLRPPGDWSPGWYKLLYGALNFVGGNFGRAKNADDKKQD